DADTLELWREDVHRQKNGRNPSRLGAFVQSILDKLPTIGWPVTPDGLIVPSLIYSQSHNPHSGADWNSEAFTEEIQPRLTKSSLAQTLEIARSHPPERPVRVNIPYLSIPERKGRRWIEVLRKGLVNSHSVLINGFKDLAVNEV